MDEFIDRVLTELTRLGHDVSKCDGEDEPAIILAHWIHAEIENAKTPNDAAHRQEASQ